MWGTDCSPNRCRQPNPGDNWASGIPFPVTLPADLPYVDPSQTSCGRRDNIPCHGPDPAHCPTCFLDPYTTGEDVFYQFVVTEPVSVVITLDPKGTPNTGFVIATSLPCPDFSEEVAVVTGSTGEPQSTGCLQLEPDVPYVVMADTMAPPPCIPDFALRIEECTVAPIPTVSEWGMVVMILAVVTAGILVFTRRRPARA
jgi:hypothetical protein